MKLFTKTLGFLASMGTTVIALILINSSIAHSESIPISLKLEHREILITQQNDCIDSSSREYIYGTYQIEWTYQGLSYKSILRMQGGSGQMLTQYFNPNTNSPDTVLQTMKLYTCSFGLVIAGYNPRYPNSQNAHPTYTADNLLIKREPDGSLNIFNCDDTKNCSPARIREVD